VSLREVEGIQRKRQPIGDVDRTDRFRSCREQDTMGGGAVRRGQALL
jgi:hypothetical protein